jgi:hypothetical protein
MSTLSWDVTVVEQRRGPVWSGLLSRASAAFGPERAERLDRGADGTWPSWEPAGLLARWYRVTSLA